MLDSRRGRRVAIVAGVRTPFAKSGTVFRDVSATALARHAARELLYRSEIDGREIDEVMFSQVVPSPLTPNVAREVSLLPQLPPERARLHLEPCLRLRGAGDQQRRRPDPAGSRRRHHSPAASSRSPIFRSCIHAASARFWSMPARRAASAAGLRRSAGRVRGTWCRSRRPSPSPPPARRWGSRPRRWPRRTASPARSRTGSR